MASEASHGVECEWGGALWWWPLFGTLGEGGLVTDTVTLTPTARRCNRRVAERRWSKGLFGWGSKDEEGRCSGVEVCIFRM